MFCNKIPEQKSSGEKISHVSKLLRHEGAQEKLANVPYILASSFGLSSRKKMVALVVSEVAGGSFKCATYLGKFYYIP